MAGEAALETIDETLAHFGQFTGDDEQGRIEDGEGDPIPQPAISAASSTSRA